MSRRLEILIVDDEEPVRETFVSYLTGVVEDGEPVFNLTAVGNFEAAESELKGKTFDGVLLDLLFPEREKADADAGARLLEVMRANPATGDAAIVVLTGYATVDRAVELTKRGACEVLQKPVAPEELAQILQRAVEQRALHTRVSELVLAAIKANEADLIFHRINNDLNKIVGEAEYVMYGLPSEEGAIPLTTELRERVKHIINLAKGASDHAYSGIGQIGKKRGGIEIRPTLEGCVENLLRDYRMKRIGVDRSIDENIPSMENYPDAVVQVFYTLIENAFEATPLDGTINLSAKYDAHEKVLDVRISDDGPGMDPEQIRLALAGGYSTKGSRHGLGLSASERFVQSLGGYLQIESEKDKGTTVIISIPWREDLIL